MFNLKKVAIARKIRNDPYYRFNNLTEIQIAVELGIKIDVNQATVDDWLRLPGISIHQGKLLVELVAKGVKLLCLEDVAAALNIPTARIIALEPILQFSYYDRLTTLSPEKINLNQASLTEISTITVLNRNLAQLIIDNRETIGKYRNILDLQQRLNLDSATISKLMHYVRFS